MRRLLRSSRAAATALPAWAGRALRPGEAPAPDESVRSSLHASDKDGRTSSSATSSRIVSLNGDVTETIFALGLGGNLVGVDTSAPYPARRVARLPKIGYQRTLSAEGILSLRPTVVIGTAEAGPPEVIQQLRSAGVRS